MTYMAGWNLPGCLPEMEPVYFNTYEDAEAWLQAEINSFIDNDPYPTDADPYVYWIVRA